MKNHRLFLTMSEDEFRTFEIAREKLGMNRSMYVRYLISGQKELRPPTIRYTKLIDKLCGIERDLRIIAAKDSLEVEERLEIMAQLEEIKKCLSKNYGAGQYDPKGGGKWLI